MSHKEHRNDLIQITKKSSDERLEETIKGRTGREYWRSLEEYSDTPRFRDYIGREFPALNAEIADPSMLTATGRRSFIKIMGASMALAGLTACTRQPKELIVPYVKTPDGLVPGKAQYYATAMPFQGVANGLLVESHEGRPTKIEGNPWHPGKGGTTAFEQASVLQLYDPDRSQTASKLGDARKWGEFLDELKSAMDGQATKGGAGLRILTEYTSSPTFIAQMKSLLEKYPQAKWIMYEATGRDSAKDAAQIAFGSQVNPVYSFDKAEIIVSLDFDFLTQGPGSVRYARDFAQKRKLTGGAKEMNRLYVVESTMTSTGAKADHRLSYRASEIESIARAIAEGVGVAVPASGALTPEAKKYVDAVVKDFKNNSGKSLMVVGNHQPTSVHLIAHAINNHLGAVGATVTFTDPLEGDTALHVSGLQALSDLVKDMKSEKVDLLVIVDSNPVFTAPKLNSTTFKAAMEKVPLRVHMGMYNDETAEYCHWHIAESHFLESWSDARAYDGTVSIVQPLIIPLYESRSPHELVSAMLGQGSKTSLEIVKEYWQTNLVGGDFETLWKKSLHDGIVTGTALAPKTVALNAQWVMSLSQGAPSQGKYEIVFRPDPCVHDGRFANNGWLQELPKPINKITWDNFAIISAKTAHDLNVKPNEEPYQGDAKMITLTTEGGELALPVWVQPGHPDNSITVFLGYGRKRAGSVGNGLGFDTYQLRTASAPFIATKKVNFAAATGTYLLASTQEHFNIDSSGIKGIGENAFIPGKNDLEDRHIVRVASLEEYKTNPGVLHHFNGLGGHTPKDSDTMYPAWDYSSTPIGGYAWAMSIDMNACVGCNACVVACQSENNIAVVGKKLVAQGRIMHWLRIDTYFKGDTANPEVYFQPMMCQHCENAPCELVCPVNATVHDAEGLNVQVYNRCVGTRYCSNNCPYKVRRFNYFLYGDWDTPSLKNVRNPEVTVRSRGVMEKCTFCVQRIMGAKVEAEKQDRKVKDGEILTACQSSCPTDAIIFGDQNDPNSKVHQLKFKEPRSYGVLADLNVKPRAGYLAPIRNTNVEIAGHKNTKGHGEGHA